MKKTSLTLLFIYLFAAAEALYFGNPCSPEMVSQGLFITEDAFLDFKAGYQMDYVFDKRLKSYAGAKARMDEFQALLNQGVITFNFVDRIEAYASVGSMQVTCSHRPHPNHSRREYQSSYKVTWGVGGRILIYEWTHACLSLQGGYQWANPHIKWDALNGEAFTTSAVMRYREGQVGLGLSYQIDTLIPYIAIKYSDVHGLISSLRRSNLNLKKSHFKMTNRDHFGLVLGCTLTSGKYFDLTVESRLIDEQAISLAGDVKF